MFVGSDQQLINAVEELKVRQKSKTAEGILEAVLEELYTLKSLRK